MTLHVAASAYIADDARIGEGSGDLRGARVAVLGPSYRGGAKETAFSGMFPVVAALREVGAHVVVHDPMYSDEEILGFGWAPYHLGEPVDAALVQADHAEYRAPSSTDTPGVQVILDGRRVLSASGRAIVIGCGRGLSG